MEYRQLNHHNLVDSVFSKNNPVPSALAVLYHNAKTAFPAAKRTDIFFQKFLFGLTLCLADTAKHARAHESAKTVSQSIVSKNHHTNPQY